MTSPKFSWFNQHTIPTNISFYLFFIFYVAFQDLAKYNYDDLVVSSMARLCRYYSAHENVFHKAVQAQV